MENMNKCPGCSHHCDRNNLQCAKGEAYFNGEANPNSEHTHTHHKGKHHGQHEGSCHGQHEGKCCGHHEGKHKGYCEGKHHAHSHRHPEFSAGSLADLMAQCGHRLFHGSDESMFAALTENEQTMLKNLLSKLLSTK